MFSSDPAFYVFLRTLLYWALTVFPCLAVSALAVRKGVRDVAAVGLIGLAGMGVFAYLAFWFWFLLPMVGGVYSLLLPFAAIGATYYTVWKLDRLGRHTLRSLLTPLALCGAVALLIVSAGFLYGGLNHPLETASVRFSHPLAADNTLPYLFAAAVVKQHIPSPLFTDWLSSDRPPLQTSCVLSQWPYLADPPELSYQVLSVVLQSLWVFALWLLLAVLRIERRAIALALAVCIFSGFAFLNGFFVWPKLLAAAFSTGFCAAVLRPASEEMRKARTRRSLLGGVLLGLGFLAHGGTAFAAFGIGLAVCIISKRINLKQWAAVTAAAVFVYAPWLLYQKLYDPPGDRLLKWHLAGVQAVDKRPFGTVFLEAYARLTPHDILMNKLANLQAVFDHFLEYWGWIHNFVGHLLHPSSQALALVSSAGAARGVMFHFFIPNLAFLTLGIPALAFGLGQRFRTAEWKAAASLWLCVLLTAVVWCLLMFEPGSAVIHQGAYFMVLAAYAASVLGLWAVSPKFALVVGLMQIVLNVALYTGVGTEKGPLEHPVLQPGMLVACLSGAALVLILIRNLAREPELAPRPEPATVAYTETEPRPRGRLSEIRNDAP